MPNLFAFSILTTTTSTSGTKTVMKLLLELYITGESLVVMVSNGK